MTKYTQKSFSVGGASKLYDENFDRIFRKPKVDSGFPDAPEDVRAKIKELHKTGDRSWENGHKGASQAYHDEAYELGKPYGLNPKPCAECGCYMPERDLAEHRAQEHAAK